MPRMRSEEGGPARHAPPLHLEVPTRSTSCAGPPATSRANRRPRAAPCHRLRKCSAAGSTASSQIHAHHRPRRPPRPPPQKLIVTALVHHERPSRRRACSKVVMSRGLHDRRVRLSVLTAIQFYDIQDCLGVDQPSKAIEWLIRAAAAAIDALPSLDCSFTLPAASPPADDAAEVSTSETSKGSVLSLANSPADNESTAATAHQASTYNGDSANGVFVELQLLYRFSLMLIFIGAFGQSANGIRSTDAGFEMETGKALLKAWERSAWLGALRIPA